MFLHPLRKSSPSWRLLTHSIRHERSFHSFPTTKTCPSPTCACAETPEMPPGLPIDHSKPLNGTMASYAEQVLICTGRGDWSSKIEEENSGDNLAADIGELVGKGGMFADVLCSLLFSLPPLLPSSLPPLCNYFCSVGSKKLMVYITAISPPFHPQHLPPPFAPNPPHHPNNLRLPPTLLQIHPLPPARILRFRARSRQGPFAPHETTSAT